VVAHHVVIPRPTPPARFVRLRRLMTPAELCAQTDRPERCLRRIYRERHGVDDRWRPDDGDARGYGEGRRHWGGEEDEDDGDEDD
jgi:hypothetical protein